MSGTASTLVGQTGTLFSATAGTANKVNVYYAAGVLTVQNLSGVGVVLAVRLV